jgi:osmotically-inducible protein OsmY
VQPPERAGDRLEREVRAKLFGDPQLSGSGSIVVIVDGQHVVLQGWVASVNERTLAEADAATVAGVAAVDDRLLIRPRGR